MSKWSYVREYVTTSLWGGLAAVAPPRRLLNLAKFSPAYTDTLWYFQGGRPLPVSLTIDDAPGDPALMHEVLDLLKEAQIKVTFFVISSLVEQEGGREVLQRMVHEGHELANHLVIDAPASKFTESEFEHALLTCERCIQDVQPGYGSDGKQKWFRPPHGILNATMQEVLKRHAYRSVLGDVYAIDVNASSQPDWIVDFMMRHCSSGSILIAHSPDVLKSRQIQVYIIKQLIERIKDRSIRVLPLGELDAEAKASI